MVVWSRVQRRGEAAWDCVSQHMGRTSIGWRSQIVFAGLIYFRLKSGFDKGSGLDWSSLTPVLCYSWIRRWFVALYVLIDLLAAT